MSTHTIYALIDPRNGSIRYVGKTVYSPEQRLKEHMMTPQGSREKLLWIKELKELGMQPIAKAIEKDIETHQEADEKEAFWTQYYFSKGEPLTNIRNTGRGLSYSLSEEETESGEKEEWMSIAAAAKKLGVPAQQIAVLIARGTIRSEKDFINDRIRFVEYNEVKKAFLLSRYYRARIKEQ